MTNPNKMVAREYSDQEYKLTVLRKCSDLHNIEKQFWNVSDKFFKHMEII